MFFLRYYDPVKTGFIHSEKKIQRKFSILKIPEKKMKIFINLKSPRFPSIAAAVLKTRTVQNLQNSLQIGS